MSITMEFTFTEQISIILGIIGLIFGAIGTIYGIKKKRELTRSKLRTEQAKRRSYSSKTKANEMKEGESLTNIMKNLRDLFWRK